MIFLLFEFAMLTKIGKALHRERAALGVRSCNHTFPLTICVILEVAVLHSSVL